MNVCVLIALCELHYSDAVLNKTTRSTIYRHHCVLQFGVLFSSSLGLFHFLTLVFHLKQKHEEGKRLLHYLRQTNTSCSDIHIYNVCVINRETSENAIKCLQS
jgi:hypothetical protein